MNPKHSIDAASSDRDHSPQIISLADLTTKINSAHRQQSISPGLPSQEEEPPNYIAINDTLQIIKGNPTPQEIAVLTSIFTVLAARDKALRSTQDHWPSPHPDAAMRGPFGTFTKYRTNLRWW